MKIDSNKSIWSRIDKLKEGIRSGDKLNKLRESRSKELLESKIHILKLQEFCKSWTEKPIRNQRLVFILGGLTFFLITASLIFLADMLVADIRYGGTFGGWHYCTSESNSLKGHTCGAGEGDCDTNRDCMEGLICVQDVGGRYGWPSGVDVCERPAITTTTIPTSEKCPKDALFGWDYCSAECPCKEDEGDCDSDMDCKPGLECKGIYTHDFGGGHPEISGMKAVDICTRKPVKEECRHYGEMYDWNYCSESCPCKEGEGDCDSDKECESSLKCMQDAGGDYGVAFNVDVCE